MSAPFRWLRNLDPARLLDAADRRDAEPHGAGGKSPHEDGGASQTPSPWAIAVVVLALLGFGVLVGSTVSPAQTGAPASVLVAASGTRSSGASTGASAATAPPAKAESTPSASSPSESESGSEEAKEETKEAAGKKSKGGANSGAKSGANTKSSGKSSTKGSKASSGSSEESKGSQPASSSDLPPIEHVFLIVLSDEGYQATFGGGSKAPYFSQTLPKEGELIESYYAVASGEPANGIALISGQGPTPQTIGECRLYASLSPASAGAEGQTLGSGCVYPSTTLTLADELASAGKTWKAYIEGVDSGGPGAASSCRHPQIGESDPDGAPSATDPYETWRNPFVYFDSLIDGTTCAKDDVGIGQLASDLSSASKTATVSYIAPDACDDGSPTPCAPGKPAGVAPAEQFLRKTVPEIESSPAYKEGGLIAITFDHAPQTGPQADSSGCCLSVSYPNLTGAAAPSGTASGSAGAGSAGAGSAGAGSGTGAGAAATSGGGKVGLALISKYVKPGSLNLLGEYNHFSLLLSIEKLFGLKPLGYAGAKGLLPFDSSVYNASK